MARQILQGLFIEHIFFKKNPGGGRSPPLFPQG
jgi:hypothetical protein